MEPVFLGLEEVLAIHRDQIQRYGGSPGIRDLGTLQSALAMPAASFGGRYLHQDLFEMAAAYLFHIVSNHPFVDGNKRVGAVAAFIFLSLNGVELKASGASFGKVVMRVAKGEANKAEVAKFLRNNS